MKTGKTKLRVNKFATHKCLVCCYAEVASYNTANPLVCSAWLFVLSREVVLFKRFPFNASYSTGVSWAWQNAGHIMQCE